MPPILLTRPTSATTEGGSLAIVVTEMATNLVKHAGAGTMVVEPSHDNGSSGVRVLALDKGPGIRDLSARSAGWILHRWHRGNGFGRDEAAVARFRYLYGAGPGNRRAWRNSGRRRRISQHFSPIDVGVVSVPIKGEDVCGDGWGAGRLRIPCCLMVVDGLGHGILAVGSGARSGADFCPGAEAIRPLPSCRIRTTR